MPIRLTHHAIWTQQRKCFQSQAVAPLFREHHKMCKIDRNEKNRVPC